jgi:hypothetical protein
MTLTVINLIIVGIGGCLVSFSFPFRTSLLLTYSLYSVEWVSGSLERQFMIATTARVSRVLMNNRDFIYVEDLYV